METYYMPEGEKSLFGLKAQYVAMVSYIVLIVFRLYRTIIFIVNSAYLEGFSLLDKITAFFSTYFYYAEYFLALLPLAILLLERKSKLVRFHCFQCLFISLVLPLVFGIAKELSFLIISLFGINDVQFLFSFYHWVILLYGIIIIFTTFVAGYATCCAYKGHTNKFPLFSSCTILFALYSKIVTIETAQTLLKRRNKRKAKESGNH